MNHPLRGRRKRTKQLVLACSDRGSRGRAPGCSGDCDHGEASGMAPPAGYSADQLIFDDQFSGTSLNSAHWNTFMAGQGGQVWNSDGLPAGDSAAGTFFHQTYFSPSQVSVNNGLTLTMVPDTQVLIAGLRVPIRRRDDGWQIHTSERLRPDQSQDVRCIPGRLARHLVHRSEQRGRQLKRSTCRRADSLRRVPGCRVALQRTTSSCRRTTHHPASQSDFSYATPKPMNAGFNIYGMQYIPGRSIKTYFNGRLVGSWTQNISTTPYEIVIWNSQASVNASGFHTTGESPNPSDLSVAEVQVYALSR